MSPFVLYFNIMNYNNVKSEDISVLSIFPNLQIHSERRKVKASIGGKRSEAGFVSPFVESLFGSST